MEWKLPQTEKVWEDLIQARTPTPEDIEALKKLEDKMIAILLQIEENTKKFKVKLIVD